MAGLDRLLIEQALQGIIDFLDNYLPLANAHVADFLIEDYWNKLVPEDIQEDLLKLSEAELARLPSCALYDPSDVKVYNKVAQDDSQESDKARVGKPCSDANHFQERTTWDRSKIPVWNHKELKTFVLNAQHFTLPYCGILSNIKDLVQTWQKGGHSKTTIRQFMSEKKSHEVDVMADVCSALAASKDIGSVIDIGSGRGYLSSHLCLMHGLSVVAVDSSTVNTKSARTRSQRLEKHWNGLVRNANKASQPPTKPTLTQDNPSDQATLSINNEKHHIRDDTQGASASEGSREQSRKNPHAKCVQLTQFVTPDTNLQQLVKDHLSCDDTKFCDEANDSRSCSDCECGRGRAGCAEDAEQGEIKLLLTGLHTCGNLAASMLEIFCQGQAAALCNVGCCYHHLDEAFIKGPFEGEEVPQHLGFPMSQMLLERGFQLGRNARMLASQTPARMATTDQVSHRSLFYRALLQVMLRDLTGEVSDDWHVGKIFAKSRDFQDYVQRALRKLKMDDRGKMTPEVVADYEARHAADQHRLTAFVQLRATLAPVVETAILLDRLLYLKEQDHVAEAHLVQLFDTVTSPRCYGIIAVRR